ncbi:GTA-gp10 family protein [Rhabdaerophilum calidifontis]|uniref:GTA-gp10 family protein n=1 Tax=Rhabdaerophilum calidifontis TaxID=2604328 RepID=UPI00123B9E9B|nr:GTA-gp10 family protein [Rhabdaerophilum calidifontis]
MANRHRGEVTLVLDGTRFTLRLTLQALAEIETALELPGLGALGARLGGGRLSARDLAIVLAAAIRGGGAAIDDETVAARVAASDLPAVLAALGVLFEASFAGEAGAARPPDPPLPAARGA